jgi:small GTP-binding protein
VEGATVIKKKICMLGCQGVGKTSLVRQFVQSVFADKYLATIGVKIDQKSVAVGKDAVELLLWDMEGLNDIRALRSAYLRGTAGYCLVADGTRPDTLDVTEMLQKQLGELLGRVPFLLLLNKCDLTSEWKVTNERLRPLERDGWKIFMTSARTGEKVEAAFQHLAERMLEPAGAQD